MKHLLKITCFILLLAMLGSCGIVSRSRYGNGLKLNLETNWFGKREQPKQQAKPARPRNRISIQPATNETQDSLLAPEPDLVAESGAAPEDINLAMNNRQVETKSKTAHKPGKEPLETSGKEAKDYSDMPMEPNAKAAGILFYSAVALSLFFQYMSYATAAFIMPAFFAYYIPIALLLGVILAFIAHRKIKMSGYAYRGYGLVMSILIIFGIYMFIFLMYLVLIIALFAAI